MSDGHLERGVAGTYGSPVGAPDLFDAGGSAGVLPACGELSGPSVGAEVGGRCGGGMEPAAIRFVVPGTVVGKGRPRFAKRGGFMQAYTPEATANYENLVKLKAEEAMRGRAPIEGAVGVHIAIWVVPPASWSQKKRREALAGLIWPTSKPDMDNSVKGIFDAMNEIVWRDDKQVCHADVWKRYAETACAAVEVRGL